MTKKEGRTANTGFASGGMKLNVTTFCFYSSLVYADSFILRIPPDRKARGRCAICNSAPK